MELRVSGDGGGNVREVRRGRVHHGAGRDDDVLVGLPSFCPLAVLGEKQNGLRYFFFCLFFIGESVNDYSGVGDD